MLLKDAAVTVIRLLAGPDNYMISTVAMRPLRPRGYAKPPHCHPERNEVESKDLSDVLHHVEIPRQARDDKV